MKRILKWLASKFSQRSAAVGADERHTPVGVTTKENIKEENSSSDYTSTPPTLAIIRESSYEVSESSLDASELTGVDPYNSGIFDGLKAWKSRSPK
jgi:hypothetical protein